MSSKKGRVSKMFLDKTRVKRSTLHLLEMKRNNKKTPSPESIMLVNNKLDLLDSFKSSFQVRKSKSRYLTPIQGSQSKIPAVNLVSLNVNNYGLGNTRAKILSTAIRSMDRLQKINLKGNGISDTGASSILNSVNRENLRVLDLSSNRIGSLGMESLCNILTGDYCTLEEVNIESIKLSISGLINLCSSLKYNRSLKKLILANNNIGLGSGVFLADMIDYNNSITNLDLQWNFIRGSEAVTLCKSLQKSDTIKILDYSWNSLGQDRVNDSISNFSRFLFLNESIIHLDLSNNNFSTSDCKILSESIKVNHTIRGLHFDGNSGIVNALGYIEPRSYVNTQKEGFKSSRICGDLRSEENMCWICNNWGDIFIEWDPSRIVWNRRLKHFALFKLSSQTEPVYIHLEIDDFEPFLLKRNDYGVYECTRAIPKGKIRFFFSYRGVAQISNQYPVEVFDPPIEKTVHFYGEFSKKIMAVVVNFYGNENSECMSLPRPFIEEYKPPPGDVPEPDIPPWLFENSIFAGYVQDTPELLNKCFEADWANSKFNRFMKSDIIRFACKEIVRQEYQKIFYTYKYLASLSVNTSLFNVNLNTITDLYQKKGFFDKNFKLSDLDIDIKACTHASTSLQFNNTFSVVRHEFMELQVRTALDKFLRSGACKSEAEALNMFFSQSFNFLFNPSEWRIKRYYNEECDVFLTTNKELLQLIFENTKGRYTKSIEKKGLLEEDFVQMLQEHNFFNEKFTVRYGCICFHIALMTYVDEISSSNYMLAGFLEFIEALARVADLMDSQDLEKDIFLGFCKSEIPLDKKLENAFMSFSYLKPRRSRR